jgi:hypothetical protein
LARNKATPPPRTMPSSLDVLGDDEQRLAGQDRSLENRQ